MSSSVQVDNKGKGILILGEGPTPWLDDTKLTEEAKYPVNFTQSAKRFDGSLHFNESSSFLFVDAIKCTSIQSKKLWNKRLCTAFMFVMFIFTLR